MHSVQKSAEKAGRREVKFYTSSAEDKLGKIIADSWKIQKLRFLLFSSETLL